jgi:hypothetical protein
MQNLQNLYSVQVSFEDYNILINECPLSYALEYFRYNIECMWATSIEIKTKIKATEETKEIEEILLRYDYKTKRISGKLYDVYLKGKYNDKHIIENFSLELFIPEGPYCYSRCSETKQSTNRKNTLEGSLSSYKVIPCPFYIRNEEKGRQENGYCDYLKAGDWEEGEFPICGICVKSVGKIWEMKKYDGWKKK